MRKSLFFSTVAKEEIDIKIQSVMDLLAPINTSKKSSLIMNLTSRLRDFETVLLNENICAADKEDILAQYTRFVKTLLHCLKFPEKASSSIGYYFRHNYYPVGIFDCEKPNIMNQNLAKTGVTVGIALLISSIPLFIFNPVLGAIFLSAAITLLIPGCFVLMTPESPDTNKKKAEEKELFQQAAQLIKPDQSFIEKQDNHYSVANYVSV